MTKLSKALINSLEEALHKSRIEVTTDGKMERDYGKEDLNKEPQKTSKGDGMLIDEFEPGHQKLKFDIERVSKEEDETDPDDEYTKDGKLKRRKVKSTDNVNAIPDSHSKFEPAQKSAVVRWKEIKKALKNDEAIMNLEEAQAEEEEEENPDLEQHVEDELQNALAQSGQEQSPEDEEDIAQDDDDDDDGIPDTQDTDEDNDGILDEHDTDDDGDSVPDIGEDGDGDGIEDNEDTPEEDESQQELAIMRALADEGYSEAEIRHILHGHTPPQVDPLDQAKIDATNSKSQYDSAVAEHDLSNKKALADLDVEHRRRMNDAEFEGHQQKNSVPKLEVEHRKRMLDLEYEEASSAKGAQALDIEHKKRMLDLEYEAAKREKELEFEQKKKELEMKTKIKEEEARKRQKERDMQRDAKQTSTAEKKGKSSLKKSEDDYFEKAMKPAWSRSQTGQLFHPEHGYVNVMHDNGRFAIRHSPHVGDSRTISTHETKEEAKAALLDFMKNPQGMVKIPGGTTMGGKV